MVHTEEISFPRGGVVKNLKRSVKTDDNLFSISKPPKSKKPKKKKLNERLSDDIYSHIKLQGTLTYNKIQDGMIILGCVRNITNFSLEVELPGLTFANVPITNISDPFTKHLNKKLEANAEDDSELRKFFNVGQTMPVKITSVEKKEKSARLSTYVEATVNPREIYCDKSYTFFRKGMLIWCCIQSVLDHGYEINIGVKNCRVFLPFKNVDDGKIYSIGEPLWCVVHKSDIENAASTLRVSAKAEHIQLAKIEEIDCLDNIFPGMQVEFVSDRVTPNGIQGKIFDNYFSYVNEAFLKKSFQKPLDYIEGKILHAYVLYVEHATKICHLTLRPLNNKQEHKLKINEVVTGEVFHQAPNGVYMKFRDSEKGFIPNTRIMKSLPNHVDLQKTIKEKFQEKSKHKCKILDYSNFHEIYICTVEQKLIKHQSYNVEDLQLGQLVTVVINEIKVDGIVASAGAVKGFIPNLHISNAPYSDNIKKKFKTGTNIHARILTMRESNVIFTLKPGLVELEDCLTKLEQAVPGEKYTGVIVSAKTNGALVVFFGNVKGWINRKELPSNNNESPDPSEYFFRGQIVTARVLALKEDILHLTLKEPKEVKSSIRIGQIITGIVEKNNKRELVITSEDKKLVGNIPVSHLSISLNLCQAIKDTFKVGDKVGKVMCVNNELPFMFSRREAMAVTNKQLLKRFEGLHKGNIVRCSYDSDCQSGIYVVPLILNFNEKVLIEYKDIKGKKEKTPTFQYQQLLIARITDINKIDRSLKLTIRFKDVFDKKNESVVEYFGAYLKDIQYLIQFGLENNWNICQYHPGERISCRIEKIGPLGGCIVSLPNGAKGLVAPHLCPDKIQKGEELEGVFISQDFQGQYVEICLKQDICHRISKDQNGTLDTADLSTFAEKLLVKSDCVIGLLKQHKFNKQLIYFPLYLHPNDFHGNLSYYGKDTLKICICGKVGQSLIGMSKKLFLKIDKERAAINKSKERQIEMVTEEISEDDQTHQSDIVEEDRCNILHELAAENKNICEDNKTETYNVNYGLCKNINSSATISTECITQSVLPGMSSFFNKNDSINAAELSSEDDEDLEQIPKKKNKLSAAERSELLCQEEKRISKLEKELANSYTNPESPEQFERLLLAHPNSSDIWTKYISLHIAGTEIDKARSVARRALETINMTFIEEKINIWLTLLSLENMFGTKGSFEKVLEDCLKYNDSLTIYLKVIEMLAQSGKFIEMEEKIRKVKSKHKHEPNMWLEIAKIYYQSSKLREARNIKDSALKSITDKKTQLNMIVRFAIFEFKYGEEDQGAAIFETILSSDPRKVFIWTTYVDQLAKISQIEQARKILERSVCQKLPVKSMKALFLKFRKFEEKYGSPESIDEVKRRAQEYIAKVAA